MFKRDTGDAGERKAEQFLKRNGLKFVARNWHCRHGEIDLVMFDGEYLVFVEVRLRTPRGFANSAESVDWHKQRKLAQAASMFLVKHASWQDRRAASTSSASRATPANWRGSGMRSKSSRAEARRFTVGRFTVYAGGGAGSFWFSVFSFQFSVFSFKDSGFRIQDESGASLDALEFAESSVNRKP